MSNSLLEAMATGLPCLASEIGGNTDLLGGGVGRLLSPHDPGAWSEALIEVLERPEPARALGSAARQRVEADYALPVIVDRYLELYRRLLDESAADDPRRTSFRRA
jgi:glycosyltransferase involved in cell wall biosynthesis